MLIYMYIYYVIFKNNIHFKHFKSQSRNKSIISKIKNLNF